MKRYGCVLPYDPLNVETQYLDRSCENVNVKRLSGTTENRGDNMDSPARAGKRFLANSSMSANRAQNALTARPTAPNHNMVFSDCIVREIYKRRFDGIGFPPPSRSAGVDHRSGKITTLDSSLLPGMNS